MYQLRSSRKVPFFAAFLTILMLLLVGAPQLKNDHSNSDRLLDPNYINRAEQQIIKSKFAQKFYETDSLVKLPLARLVTAFGFQICSEDSVEANNSLSGLKTSLAATTKFRKSFVKYLENSGKNPVDLYDFLLKENGQLADSSANVGCINPLLIPGVIYEILGDQELSKLSIKTLGADELSCLKKAEHQVGSLQEPAYYDFLENIVSFKQAVIEKDVVKQLTQKINKLANKSSKNAVKLKLDREALKLLLASADFLSGLYYYSCSGQLLVPAQKAGTAVQTNVLTGEVTSAQSWKNIAMPLQSGTFTVSFDLTPLQNKMDGVIGFSKGSASKYDHLGPIIRFNPSGYIDARNAGAYRAVTQVAYTANKIYKFSLTINVATKTYSATVKLPDGTSKTIATNYAFRSSQAAVASLNNVAYYSYIGKFKAAKIILGTTEEPNLPPVVNAGADRTITLPANSVTITGTVTDSDGTIASRAWTKVSGGNSTLSGQATNTLTVSGLVAGTYVFKLTATDDDGASTADSVTVIVNSAANNPPTVNAGADRTITLPTSSLSLAGTTTDSDGTVRSIIWTKVSGGAANLTNANTNTLTASGLVAGTYIFRLTATDDDGASASDEVRVVVQPATGNVSVTLQWDPVTQNTDGSAISDLVGYRVYLGTASGSYQAPREAGLGANLVLTQLTAGTRYYVVVKAYNGSEVTSANSLEFQFVAPNQ